MGLSNKNTNPFLWIFTVFFFVMASSCSKEIPERMVFYDNDFEKNQKTGFVFTGVNGLEDSLKIVPFNNNKLLGRFSNNYVEFNAPSVPEHNVLKIEFDLYLHDNWRGNFIAPGSSFPDIWQMKLDNNPIYVTTFSNVSNDQSFPDNYQSILINNKAFSNSWGKFQGVCSKAEEKDGTSFYKIEYITGHKGAVQLIFQDVNFSGSNQCLKSWSIDNLKLTAINKK